MTTSSDKAKSKLLDSMRMSKGSADTGTTEKPATAKPAGKAAAKKSAKKPAASKKPAAKKAKAAKPGNYSTREGRVALIADTFESGQRIWPD